MRLRRVEFEGNVHAVKEYRLIVSQGTTHCEEDFICLPWRTFGKPPNSVRKPDTEQVTCLGCIATEE
jgi:hypothetical protein